MNGILRYSTLLMLFIRCASFDFFDKGAAIFVVGAVVNEDAAAFAGDLIFFGVQFFDFTFFQGRAATYTLTAGK